MKKISSDMAKVFQDRVKHACPIELNNELHSAWYKYHKVSYDVPWSLSFSGHKLYFSDVCVGFCLVFVSGRLNSYLFETFIFVDCISQTTIEHYSNFSLYEGSIFCTGSFWLQRYKLWNLLEKVINHLIKLFGIN